MADTLNNQQFIRRYQIDKWVVQSDGVSYRFRAGCGHHGIHFSATAGSSEGLLAELGRSSFDRCLTCVLRDNSNA